MSLIKFLKNVCSLLEHVEINITEKQSNTLLSLIKEMHTKFKINNDNNPVRLSTDEKVFRSACLQEELNEFNEAATIEDEADALLDLIVFSLGTLERMGLLEKTEEMFLEVMKANLAKEVGGTKKREGTPAFSIDLTKPKGWTAPDLKSIIEDKKFNV